jgi:hypothetical protein
MLKLRASLKRFLRLGLPFGLLLLAFSLPTVRPAYAELCYYSYYDTIYTDATKSEPCGSYDSCTRTYDGCITPYRTTEIGFCCR